jgi:hypothetical protein
LTYVVTCWLELCGKPCLHGASLLFPEGTITCLAHKGTGKSSLTVALLKAGGRLMCDDITPVNIMGSAGYVLPGPPMMHVWPVQRDALGLTAAPPSQRDSKPIKTYVNVFAGEPEIYCKEPQEFGKIFILERDPQRTIGAIEVTRLGPAEALFQLSNYTFAPLLVRALQLEKQRTALLSVAASGYPVFRIKYPTDLNRISEVASAILNS